MEQQISMDGLNVNWKVFKILQIEKQIDEKLAEMKKKNPVWIVFLTKSSKLENLVFRKTGSLTLLILKLMSELLDTFIYLVIFQTSLPPNQMIVINVN